jgi:serine O-acetyltransferase
VKDYIRHFFFDSGYYAVVCYRLARYFMVKKFPPFGKRIPFLPSLIARHAISRCGCEINCAAEIGEGLIIDHSPGIVIGAKVRMGRKVKVFSCVTIGGKNLIRYELDMDERYPLIGDDVVIFTGAKVLGPVRIGDGSVIGANAVVLESVPEGATAVGVPARVVSRGG